MIQQLELGRKVELVLRIKFAITLVHQCHPGHRRSALLLSIRIGGDEE